MRVSDMYTVQKRTSVEVWTVHPQNVLPTKRPRLERHKRFTTYSKSERCVLPYSLSSWAPWSPLSARILPRLVALTGIRSHRTANNPPRSTRRRLSAPALRRRSQSLPPGRSRPPQADSAKIHSSTASLPPRSLPPQAGRYHWHAGSGEPLAPCCPAVRQWPDSCCRRTRMLYGEAAAQRPWCRSDSDGPLSLAVIAKTASHLVIKRIILNR